MWILTYGHGQVLIHPLAMSKQKLWSLHGSWEHLLLSVIISNLHCWVKVISLAGITRDLETKILLQTMYLEKYLKVLENVKYFRNIFKYKYFEKVFKYFQIQMYLTPCLEDPGQ